MSACMRLPSRMGTMTLRSMMAMDSSSSSMALRRAMVAASCGLAWADASPDMMALLKITRQVNCAIRCIPTSFFAGRMAELDSVQTL